jgi:iron complex outermembrane recepter protein
MSSRKSTNSSKRIAEVLGTASVLCLAQAVHAELASGDAAPNGAIEEIIVTATKRETNLQETPVAITVFSQAALDQNLVVDISDAVKFVPGVAYAEHGDQAGLTITMRGIGNDTAFTELDSPEVAMYVNGIYSPRSQGASTLLYDMDRVEVLRGPQGTLFGHNSTVGVIDLFTAKPQIGVFAGNAEVSAGDYNAYGSRGMLNIPVNDTLAFRIAFAQEKHDGYVQFQGVPTIVSTNPQLFGAPPNTYGLNTTPYVTLGPQYDSEDRTSYRLSGRWLPIQNLSWDLSYEHYVDRGIPEVPLMQAPRPGEPLFSILASFAPANDRKSDNIRSNISWGINDYLNLTYIAGKSRMSGTENAQDDAGLAIPTSPTTPGGGALQDAQTVGSEFDSYSNELQLKSTGTHLVDWIVGLYAFRERNFIRFDINQYNGYAGGPTTFNWAGAFIQPDRSQEDRSEFAQAVLHATDSLRFTAGVRDSFDDERDIGGRNVTFNGCPPPNVYNCGPFTYGLNLAQLAANNYAVSDNDAYTSSHKVTYLGRVDFDFTRDLLGYVSVGTGYHPGRVEDGGTHDNPETLTNYEIGEKSTLFDGRMTLNAALYYEDFKGYQVTSVVTTRNAAGQILASQTEQVNAQGAKGYGLEIELAAKPTPLDSLQYSSSLMHTKMENLLTVDSRLYSLNPADPLAHVTNIAGNQLPHAPLFSMTLGYDHSFPLTNGDSLLPHVAFHYETRSFLSYYNETVPIQGVSDWDQQRAYTRTDFTLSYRGGGERKYEIQGYVQNIENKDIKTNSDIYKIEGVNNAVGLYMPPRIFGLRARYRF